MLDETGDGNKDLLDSKEDKKPPSLLYVSSESFIRRVRSVDPNKGRCLIENVPEDCIVDITHCFPKRMFENEELIASLEWHWNTRRGTLNLDTRYNLFPARPHLHHLHKNPKSSGSWTLLPPDDIVKQYHSSLVQQFENEWIAERDTFPVIENGKFKYRFLAFGFEASMTDLVITRQNGTPGGGPPSLENLSVHTYPFQDLPLLESHLHPKFVILEAGRKLAGLSAERAANLVQEHPVLTLIGQIYSAWTRPCPDPDFPSAPTDSDANDEANARPTDGIKRTPPPPRRT